MQWTTLYQNKESSLPVMSIANENSLILPDSDGDLIEYPFATKSESKKYCSLNAALENVNFVTNEVGSDEWCVTPQSSATDVKEIFQLWNSESKGSRRRVLSCARELCANVLGGAWRSLSLERFRMKPITGGMSNLLFLVEMPESIGPFGKEPRKALLRILCGTDLERRLNESIIFTVLSERSLGPKLLGVFPGGRFEQFIPSRPLCTREIAFPSVARRIGQMLARIHSLDVPVAKKPTVIDVAEGYLRKLRKLNRRMVHKMKGNMVEADEKLCPPEVNCEVLARELDIMKQCLLRSNSPVVFSHNDLQEMNILLHDKYTLDHNGNLSAKEDETPFALIDFEYASYNYRGFDFANHICEHIIDYSNESPPYYTIFRHHFPTEADQRHLMNSYLDEMDEVMRKEQGSHPAACNGSDNPQRRRETQLQELLAEARGFIAVSHLFWSIWSFELAEESPIEFDYVSYGIDRLALYYAHKKDLLEYHK